MLLLLRTPEDTIYNVFIISILSNIHISIESIPILFFCCFLWGFPSPGRSSPFIINMFIHEKIFCRPVTKRKYLSYYFLLRRRRHCDRFWFFYHISKIVLGRLGSQSFISVALQKLAAQIQIKIHLPIFFFNAPNLIYWFIRSRYLNVLFIHSYE